MPLEGRHDDILVPPIVSTQLIPSTSSNHLCRSDFPETHIVICKVIFSVRTVDTIPFRLFGHVQNGKTVLQTVPRINHDEILVASSAFIDSLVGQSFGSVWTRYMAWVPHGFHDWREASEKSSAHHSLLAPLSAVWLACDLRRVCCRRMCPRLEATVSSEALCKCRSPEGKDWPADPR
jgi:hypothetical protein